MDFYYRATPTKSSETVFDAFRRLVESWGVRAGDLLPQARTIEALAPLREVHSHATVSAVDLPLSPSPASVHWKQVLKATSERGLTGLSSLRVLYGTHEKTAELWEKLEIPIKTPIERAIRSGFDFVAKRAVFEVSLDISRGASKPAFRSNEERILKGVKQHRDAIYKTLPAGPARPGVTREGRWGKPGTASTKFVTKWLAEHPELDRLTLGAAGTPAALLAYADLFSAGKHDVMAMLDAPFPLANALSMFAGKKTYAGLLATRSASPRPELR